MKILYIADLHMKLRQFEWLESQAANYDLAIIGGDLLELAHPKPKTEQIAQLIPRLQQLCKSTRLIVASGNHDGNQVNASKEEYAAWIRELSRENLTVDGARTEVQGYRFSCFPWWNGAQSRAEMLTQLESDKPAPGMPWIWVHHAPPRGSRTAWTRKGNVGDPYLQKLIGRFHPDIALCGHIHNAPFYAEGAWCEKLGRTWVFNPGMQIGDTPCHIALDLRARKAAHTSLEGRDQVELS